MASSAETLFAKPTPRVLDFIVPHDGMREDIPPEEQSIVADRFVSLVGDTFFNHLDKVPNTDSGESRLILGSEPTAPGTKWKLKITRRGDFEPIEGIDHADQSVATIELTRQLNGRQHEQFSYRLGADGVLRRQDVEDVEEKNRLQAEFQKLKDSRVKPELGYLLSDRELMRQAAENRVLERKMGVNMQPVGLAEIEGLAEFISHSGFDAPKPAGKRS